MKAEYQKLVNLINSGATPIAAMVKVYGVSPVAAGKRLYRVLRHKDVFAALDASPVATKRHTRQLMRGVWAPQPADPASVVSVQDRLYGLLYRGETLDLAGWTQLLADYKAETPFPKGDVRALWSDYALLEDALVEAYFETDRRPGHPAPTADPNPPREWMSLDDLLYEARAAREAGPRQDSANFFTPVPGIATPLV